MDWDNLLSDIDESFDAEANDSSRCYSKANGYLNLNSTDGERRRWAQFLAEKNAAEHSTTRQAMFEIQKHHVEVLQHLSAQLSQISDRLVEIKTAIVSR